MYRTDIRGYYRHINKGQLKRHVDRFIPEPNLRVLIHQYVDYSVEDGGEFYTPPSGIPRGCALSPLLGASFLWYVDGSFERERGLYYVRYMDDFLFLSPRRWPVRRAIARLHAYFDDTGFACHPDKTMAGRVEKGFDWLGVWFDERGPAGIAPRALENHRVRCLRLEEQARRRGLPEDTIRMRVQQYETRWGIWADSVLRSAATEDTLADNEGDSDCRIVRAADLSGQHAAAPYLHCRKL
ncbi:reverse transcriptase domain-containing protein [Escherichia coli]|nr:reverse transcriptase domain-containing protein [Escherichia coli]MCQ5477324.1 reverse transcriptase domain-containing protein [Escherichia coli]MCQ5483029.1 reverse transcriptase domain-containing protein [Escherichia coli]MCQ5488038.1 reverse transcriptase domain-containing protein [Escherichia coli]MCQ5492662.1 reverse transcriptase domain-containing protein [Escherichia coli]MCQ5502969.1 reverse transcriptase domain-containing protein [Escherichia coli]